VSLSLYSKRQLDEALFDDWNGRGCSGKRHAYGGKGKGILLIAQCGRAKTMCRRTDAETTSDGVANATDVEDIGAKIGPNETSAPSIAAMVMAKGDVMLRDKSATRVIGIGEDRAAQCSTT
jgi:hypothetical protein